MRKIDLNNYQRRALFEAFRDRDIPVLSVTVMIDITFLKPFIDENSYGFFMSLSFLITKAVNLVPELRHRIIAGELFEFDQVDPNFTVSLENRTFSFCDSRYFGSFKEYRSYTSNCINEVIKLPNLSTTEKHHMFFMTNLPWFSFTSITHPYYKKYGSIPIITIGKYYKQSKNLLIPVGIQVHHGLVDGIHIGDFYENLSIMCKKPAEHLR